MMMKINVSLLLAVLIFSTHDVYSFVTSSKQLSSLVRDDISCSSFQLKSSSSSGDQVKKLLEQAAKIRKELAALEGKTVEEVEKEARDKKEQRIQAESVPAENKSANKSKSTRDYGQLMDVPENSEDQVLQAAAAIERAFKDGKTRQTIRLTLVKDGEPIASEAVDEWPGGAKQMYRESGNPLTEELVKQIRLPSSDPLAYNLPPRIITKDIYDFDGTAIISTENDNEDKPVVKAMVFPNTDVKYLGDITKMQNEVEQSAGGGLSLLVNPFWSNVESWGFNILAPGGKKKAKEVVFDQGYGEETYVVSRFSARGERVVSLKVYPYDWQLFAYLEQPEYSLGGIPLETAVRLGSSKEEPTSAMYTELLNELPEFKLSRNMRNINRLFDE